MNNSENSMMDDMGMEEDLMPYPTPDKQYPNAAKYSSYESIQTGAMGKVINSCHLVVLISATMDLTQFRLKTDVLSVLIKMELYDQT